MSFGGSVSAMISSLRNNAEMLPKRKRYFSKKPTLKEIRKYYPKKGIISNSVSSKKELELIRERIVSEQRRIVRLRVIYFSLIITLLAAGGVFFMPKIGKLIYTAFPMNQDSSLSINNNQRMEFKEVSEEERFEKNMNSGKAQLQKNNWFFAAGNFEEAIRIKPKDQLANYLLALSYYKLCRYEGKACVISGNLIDKLIIEHPEIYNSSEIIQRFDTIYGLK